MKYLVTVTRTGTIEIEAPNASAALMQADVTDTSKVQWDDDWHPTDVEQIEN